MADLTMVLLAIRVPQQCCSALELDQQNAQSHYMVPKRRRYHRRVAIIGQDFLIVVERCLWPQTAHLPHLHTNGLQITQIAPA